MSESVIVVFWQFFGASLIATAVIASVRSFLMSSMSSSVTKNLPAVIGAFELKPAETAYLLREGDMTHTMVVIAVDLVQRRIKSGGEGEPLDLEPYEKKIWLNISDNVKGWAQQKIDQVLPSGRSINPMHFFSKFRALYAFITGPLRRFVSDLLKDPKKLKRYFSATGIARLAIELCSSGYKEGVEIELKNELMRRGLLVSQKRRQGYGLALAALIPVLIIVIFVLAHFLLLGVSLWRLTPLVFLGFINAAILRTLLSVPGLIPAYEEFSQVVRELTREGFRFSAVKYLLRFFKLVVYMVAGFVSLILLVLDLAIAKFALGIPEYAGAPLIVCLSICGALIVQLLLDWHALTLKEHPTRLASDALARKKKKLNKVSPLATFKNVLIDPAYDQTLSDIVAFYGVETLWLLS